MFQNISNVEFDEQVILNIESRQQFITKTNLSDILILKICL